jgi:hypothetical protein
LLWFTGSLTIPNSVTNIGSYAFDNCNGFDSTMRCEATTPPTIQSTSLPYQITTVEVPTASVSAYQAAANWSTKTIVGY